MTIINKSIQTLKVLAYLSTLPLWMALGLALYVAFDGPSNSGYFINFARINAYIYSHSYAALLLCVYAGIQIGMTIQQPSRFYVVFNFCLLFLAWYSYHSFADAQGVGLLLSCWFAALLSDFYTKLQTNIEAWYISLKIRIDLIVIILLSLILLTNR